MDSFELVPPNADTFWMRRAIAEARLGEGKVEPNPMVGAVIVNEGRIVGIGHHERFGGPHAEVGALESAGEGARGSTLYVSLEPCCHFGKTPPCTDAILRAGIRRVVVATRDPFPRVDGGGFRILQDAGLAVESGVEAELALRLNNPYFKRVLTGRPYVTAKWAMTLDGKTAVRNGDSRWISSAASRALVHELRGRMDGILVGIETAIADDPRLTVRPPGPRVPVRIVLDSSGRLPPTSYLAQTANESPVIVVVSELAPSERREQLSRLGCEVLVVPHSEDSKGVRLGSLLDVLGERGMTNLLVEGGGRVLGGFLDHGEVDSVDVYIAPILEGGDHPLTPIRGRGVSRMSEAVRVLDPEVSQVDGDIRLRAEVPQTWRETLHQRLGLKGGSGELDVAATAP